jgi:uncharacterized membrane protein
MILPMIFGTALKIMVAHFKNGNFKQGLIDGILRAGEELKYFRGSDDTNELSNEISKG